LSARPSPRRPDFFIPGAPKAGTTALYDYLRQHPQIFLPAAKELHYFGSDLERRRTPRPTLGEYLRYFADARDELRVGEASVRYLHSRLAAREIAEFSPGARAIIMLRDPVEMMYAMHSELVFIGAEDIEDFADALAAEDDRRRGRRIPPGANRPVALLYRDSARYTEQVERFFDALGRERVHVILYDDFKADTLAAVRDVLRFLEVDDTFEPAIRVVNPSKRSRSRLVRDVAANPPGFLRAVARAVMPAHLRKRVFRTVLNMNARPERRPPMDPQLRRRLRAEFAPEVERLGRLLERDLSAWSAAA
jgi:hypothetical protein